MLKDIAGAYRFRRPLRRLPFVIAIVAVFAIVGIVELAIWEGVICPEIDINCISAAVYGMYAFQAISIFPPCVARLRDIGWPLFPGIFLSFLALFTHPIQMVISLLNQANVISTSYYHSGLNLVGSTLLLIGLSVLATIARKEPG